MLFAIAHFDGLTRIIENLRRIESFKQSQFRRIEANPKLYPNGMLVMVGPMWDLDNAFKISVIVYAMEHNGDKNADRDEKVAKLLRQDTSQYTRPMTRWDAPYTSFDLDSFQRNDRLDPRTVVENITIYKWEGIALAKWDDQANLVHKLMDLLDAP